MGLLSAIRSFESGRDASFRTYAEVCIRRRLYSAIRAAQGNKHFPLNHSVSFEPPLFDGTNAYLFSSEESPEDVIIGREELRERLAALKGQLSEFEAKVLWRDRSAGGTASKVGGQRDPACPPEGGPAIFFQRIQRELIAILHRPSHDYGQRVKERENHYVRRQDPGMQRVRQRVHLYRR